MANLWGNLQSGQAMGLGTQMIQDVMKQQQDKQNLAFEKQKFNLLSSLQKAEENRNKILFQQKQEKMQAFDKWSNRVAETIKKIRKPDGTIDEQAVTELTALQALNPMGQEVNLKSLTDLLKPQEETPKGPFVVGPNLVDAQGNLLFKGEPKPEKESFAHIKSSQGGLYDAKANTWVVPPPKKDEPVTFEHITKMMEALDSLGMKDIYWDDRTWPKKNRVKKQWLEDVIGGREVAPDLAASISRMFPETKVNMAKPKATEDQMKKAYQLWKKTNTGSYEEFKAQLQ